MMLFVLVLPMAGCQKQSVPDGFPAIYPCVAIVFQDEKPLENSVVTFKQLDPLSKYEPSGTTDAKGFVTMKTYGHNGVPLGKYKVIITKYSEEGGNETVDLISGRKIIKNQQSFSLIDKQYRNESTTPYEVEVTKGKNSFQFDVGKPVHELMQRIKF